ncbi:cysteine proteinase [Microthyrium microscopicum]|uniref:Cysteine proteinase n=1 Tax=Microthyrium microscopicum TaxID=703497 RepID=A0A6A6U441_9PEZI|nr:cysteine proteinase [Microthyrium microscopicum]
MADKTESYVDPNHSAPPTIVFTQSEINDYLNFLELPQYCNLSPEAPRDVKLLTALHQMQITKVPYENLALHYSSHHSTNLDPKFIHNKILTQKGRGGYCMEISIFFCALLRAIGFNVYHTGVRGRNRKNGVPEGPFMEVAHIINIVTFPSGEKYGVDVAFGGDGMTKPMRLVAHEVSLNMGTQEVRYELAPIAQFASDHKLWIYQYRNQKDRPWVSFYCFAEVPYLHGDFVLMSEWVNRNSPFQVDFVLMIKFLWDGKSVYGKKMFIQDVLKQNDGGKTRVVRECRTEQERIQLLQEEFGIELSEEEINGIKGTKTELR